MSYYKEYFSNQDKYEKIYGIKTVIVMRIGSFYEICSFSKDSNLKKIGKKLDLEIFTINNDIIEETGINIYTLVFPTNQFNKYKNILVDLDYTVVVLDQLSNLDSNELVHEITNTHLPTNTNFLKKFFKRIWKQIKKFFKKINCSKRSKVIYT